jgi:hypothetical protein
LDTTTRGPTALPAHHRSIQSVTAESAWAAPRHQTSTAPTAFASAPRPTSALYAGYPPVLPRHPRGCGRDEPLYSCPDNADRARRVRGSLVLQYLRLVPGRGPQHCKSIRKSIQPRRTVQARRPVPACCQPREAPTPARWPGHSPSAHHRPGRCRWRVLGRSPHHDDPYRQSGPALRAAVRGLVATLARPRPLSRRPRSGPLAGGLVLVQGPGECLGLFLGHLRLSLGPHGLGLRGFLPGSFGGRPARSAFVRPVRPSPAARAWCGCSRRRAS